MPSKRKRASHGIDSAKKAGRTAALDEALDDLCASCRKLDFGAEDKYGSGAATPDYSRQSWSWPDQQPPQPCCRLSASLVPLLDSRTWDQEIRYVPPSTALASDSKTMSSSDSKIRQIVYFRKGVFAFVRTFAPIPRAAAVPSDDGSSVGLRNICLAKAWLEFCVEHHEKTCGKPPGNILPGLKVIDCVSRQVCLAKPGDPYLALSYVWGNHSIDASGDLPTVLPKTIEDAMIVARGLGIPYLWVDRYCIDQANKREKHIMVANMDKVYAGAEITIIAAAGSDPHYGLPGISTTARKNVHTETISGNGVVTRYPSLSKEIKNSVWASRGWTYQEMLLSRRRLVFSDSQMFFHCYSQDFYEMFSLHSPDFTLSDKKAAASDISDAMQLGCVEANLRHYKPDTRIPHGIGSYAVDVYSQLQEYSQRELSHSTDRLQGLEGIFGAFRRGMSHYTHHFWGIPILDESVLSPTRWVDECSELSSFLTGLLWESFPVHKEQGIWREQAFPSWSWASLIGAKLNSEFGTPADMHTHLAVYLTRLTGEYEDLAAFAHGPCDYTMYQPWIDLSTWILTGVTWRPRSKAVPGVRVPLVHHSLRDEKLTLRLDDHNEEPHGEYSAVYMGTYVQISGIDLSVTRTLRFLVAKLEDGDAYRRVGTAAYDVGHAEVAAKRDQEELVWLPGAKEGRSYNAWRFESVRLV
jgi:hypothetical protein